MSDILPPQLVGAQQSSLYVKVRTTVTVMAGAWLIMAVTGFGFFSGGTTSLAFSLILMYGTGAALIVVIAAIYRSVKKSAIRRAETAPDHTAALAFIGTTRSATEELRAALRPAAPTGRAYDPAARPVGPAVSMIEAVAAARAASNAAAVALAEASADAKVSAAAAAKAPAKPAAPAKVVAQAKTPAKPAAAKTAGAKPAVKSTATGGAKKQDSGDQGAARKNPPAAAAAAASSSCTQPAKTPRPALVLASSNPAPQAGQKTHEALTRQKAS